MRCLNIEIQLYSNKLNFLILIKNKINPLKIYFFCNLKTCPQQTIQEAKLMKILRKEILLSENEKQKINEISTTFRKEKNVQRLIDDLTASFDHNSTSNFQGIEFVL